MQEHLTRGISTTEAGVAVRIPMPLGVWHEKRGLDVLGQLLLQGDERKGAGTWAFH